MPISLSPHFSTAEDALADLEGAPPAIQAAARNTAVILEAVRSVLGVPLDVTSFWRSPEHNADVGGVPASQHMTGNAADVLARGLPVGVSYDKLRPALKSGTFPQFGQMIFYPVKGHIHVSTQVGTAHRNQVLFAYPDKSVAGGTRYELPNDEAVSALPRGIAPWWALPLLLVVALVALLLTL